MKYHFIGDQGISMKGLKEYMAYLGNEVSGSDLKTGGHKKENIDKSIDVIVRTSAVSPGSPGWVEVAAGEELGIRVIKRSELIGEITKNKKLIAISGMHGKTTVTTMIGLLLIKAGFDPTVLVGEAVKEFQNEVLRIGKSEWFVMEACEYDRSFLDFNPDILILTNIEEEHLDTYPGGLPEIKEAFASYLSKMKSNGLIIACSDDENVMSILEQVGADKKVILYGKKSENYKELKFELGVPGEHNRENALSVWALADYLKIDEKILAETLVSFSGAKRRLEYRGTFQGADLIDDYGHHPTEIRSTIEALSEKYPDKEKIVIFWPHQYKRIKPLLEKFSEAFQGADKIILKPIFFVPGRDEKLDVSSEILAEKISGKGKEVQVMETDEEIIEYLKKNLDSNKVVLTIGIPPVYKILEGLMKEVN